MQFALNICMACDVPLESTCGCNRRVAALRPVAESHCVAARRGGKQLEQNDRSVTFVNSMRPVCLASLPSDGEARTGNVGKFDIVGSP